MSIEWNEYSAKSNGGTEQLARRLEATIPSDLMQDFQIFPSRVRGELDPTKIRILWLHDLPEDRESHVLANEGWKRFHLLVFVSYWQREQYMLAYGIPPSKCIVLQNSIVPIPQKEKPTDRINLIYTPTPHRGLDILVPVFSELAKEFENIHLDVFSSYNLYGWNDQDKTHETLFNTIKSHPKMTYHGSKSNDEVRNALQNAHIFAYPSTWKETSCLCLMEAMSAGCICVHSDLAALPETAANWTRMYGYHEDKARHAENFGGMLRGAIELAQSASEANQMFLNGAKSYCDLFYNWEIRKTKWEILLRSMLDLPREIENPVRYFQYRSG